MITGKDLFKSEFKIKTQVGEEEEVEVETFLEPYTIKDFFCILF